jgi:SAM-dependent methyltransferase
MVSTYKLDANNEKFPMTQKRSPTELLEGAYAIQTPQDSLTYYHDFADHYDAEFAEKLGYVFPQLMAEFYHRNAGPNDLPVADIGCGTGLVADALKLPQDQLHGFDISPEMLEKSRVKNIYAGLHEVDLTRPLAAPETLFGAVISAGTFTHGHLGPEPLENLLVLGRSNALFCIGVNAQHYTAKGFSQVLTSLLDKGRIKDLALKGVPIYSDPNSPHGKDTAQVLVFRKS